MAQDFAALIEAITEGREGSIPQPPAANPTSDPGATALQQLEATITEGREGSTPPAANPTSDPGATALQQLEATITEGREGSTPQPSAANLTSDPGEGALQQLDAVAVAIDIPISSPPSQNQPRREEVMRLRPRTPPRKAAAAAAAADPAPKRWRVPTQEREAPAALRTAPSKAAKLQKKAEANQLNEVVGTQQTTISYQHKLLQHAEQQVLGLQSQLQAQQAHAQQLLAQQQQQLLLLRSHVQSTQPVPTQAPLQNPASPANGSLEPAEEPSAAAENNDWAAWSNSTGWDDSSGWDSSNAWERGWDGSSGWAGCDGWDSSSGWNTWGSGEPSSSSKAVPADYRKLWKAKEADGEVPGNPADRWRPKGGRDNEGRYGRSGGRQQKWFSLRATAKREGWLDEFYARCGDSKPTSLKIL
eukprot:TRINITY_DN20258_c0_g1_i12.p1 TRINITY_DN20258_c0_g1~~TRINITY_DN20258_c0_g1_i12.p1  ORF type:complete len:417 (-),score=112.17 TRINITY_DN20258_c0_g1_i12:80-1330(-)